MKKYLMAACAVVLAGTVAFAASDVRNPDAEGRSNAMKVLGKNTGVLGDMAGGKVPFDAAAAASAKAEMLAVLAQAGAVFTGQGMDDKSEASPKIWQNWEDFVAKAGDLVVAVETLDVASAEGLQAGMGAVGGACKACHQEYRVKK